MGAVLSIMYRYRPRTDQFYKLILGVGFVTFLSNQLRSTYIREDLLQPDRIQSDASNLLISIFYIKGGDPQRPNDRELNPIFFGNDTQKYRNYMNRWYRSFVDAAVNIEDTDIVVIHDGLTANVTDHFERITFLDYSEVTVDRKSVNDIRYFHYQHYLNETSVQYQRILTTDMHDVHFGADPFVYMKPQLTIQPMALHLGNDPGRRRSIWKPYVTRGIKHCIKDDEYLVNGTLEWIDTNPGYQAGCGIIGGGAHTFRLLIDEMVVQLRRANKDSDCNMHIFQTALFQICEKQKQCMFLNDAVFQAEFGAYENIGHVVYHK